MDDQGSILVRIDLIDFLFIIGKNHIQAEEELSQMSFL